MTEVVTEVVKIVITVITVLVGTGLLALSAKGLQWIKIAQQKDSLGIVDILVKGAVHLAEKQFTGQPGKDKRDFVLNLVAEQLAKRGIKVSTSEILSSIEKGVTELKGQQPVLLVEPARPRRSSSPKA